MQKVVNLFTGYAFALNVLIHTTTGHQTSAVANSLYPGTYCSVYVTGTSQLAQIFAPSGTTQVNPFFVATDGTYTFYGPSTNYDLIFSQTVPAVASSPSVIVPSLASGLLPTTAAAGSLERVTDSTRGLWMANGVGWTPINGGYANVLDFGAVGDGVADDTAAIQAAITAASAIHAAVYMPHGTYRVSTLTISTDNFRLIGAGMMYETTLQATAAAAVIVLQANYAEFRDFAIVGVSASTYGIQIATNCGIQSRFVQVDIDSIGNGPGIGADANSYSMCFTRCRLIYNAIGLALGSSSHHTVIDSCFLYSNTQAQLTSLCSGTNVTRALSVMNCDIEGATVNSGNTVYGIHANGVAPLTVLDTYFESFDSAASADIAVTGAGSNQVTMQGCYSNGNAISNHPILLNAVCDLTVSGCVYLNGAAGQDTIGYSANTNRRVYLINTWLTLNGVFTQTSRPLLTAGNSTQFGGLPLQIYSTTVQAGSVGSGATTLAQYSIPGSTIGGVSGLLGERVRIQACGTCANNMNSKTITLAFGATNIAAQNVSPAGALAWTAAGEVTIAEFSQIAFGSIKTGANGTGTVAETQSVTTPTESTTSAILVKVVGQGTSDNDVVLDAMSVDWFPGVVA